MKTVVTVFTSIALLSAFCYSQTAPIKPFINQSTVAVARVNLASVDFNALDRLADDLINQVLPADQRADTLKQIHAAVASAREWSGQFTKAGGKTAWGVLSLEDMTHGTPLFFLVPVEPGADIQALRPVLSMKGTSTVEQIHDVLVVAEGKEMPAWIKNIRPQDRPELDKAISSADANADLAIAAALTADGKKVLESMVPTLPGGQSATPLTRDLTWFSASLNARPDGHGKIVFQAANDNAARQLRDMLVALFPGKVPQGNRTDTLMATAAEFVKQAKVQKDQVVIDIQGNLTTQLAAGAADGIRAAREKARRVQAMNQIKQLMLACIVVANDKKDGQYPQTLEDAVKASGVGEQLLTNARQPGEKNGFVFVRPPDGLKADYQRLVIYEKFGQWDGVCVGFADGHVEFVSNRDAFDKLLNTATQKQKEAKP